MDEDWCVWWMDGVAEKAGQAWAGAHRCHFAGGGIVAVKEVEMSGDRGHLGGKMARRHGAAVPPITPNSGRRMPDGWRKTGGNA